MSARRPSKMLVALTTGEARGRALGCRGLERKRGRSKLMLLTMEVYNIQYTDLTSNHSDIPSCTRHIPGIGTGQGQC